MIITQYYYNMFCDANLLFWDVCVGAPGGTHDAIHFQHSFLYKDFFGENLFCKNQLSLEEIVSKSTLLCGDRTQENA
jgi:hypothetical protein